LRRVGEGGRVAALDGVRGLAILLVVLEHANTPGMRSVSVAGVTTFFVLSGYVISRGLLGELRETGGSTCAASTADGRYGSSRPPW
jgi:peptidoglycan/LPS O-acetylase OafA/YrhL